MDRALQYDMTGNKNTAELTTAVFKLERKIVEREAWKTLQMLMLAQVLDAADTDGTIDGSYGMTKPPVAPSSAIIKVDSGIDVRSLVRRCRV